MRYILFKSDGQFKHSGKYYLQGGRWHKLAENKPAPKGAPVSAHPKAAGHFEPKQHLSDEQWKQLELGSENSNAESHNKKLAQIKQLSDAGDVTGLLGLQVGSNTYGKIQGKLINQLLEAHGSPHKVVPGQKAGEHVAVQNVPAEEAPAQDEAPKTTGTQPIHKVSNPDAGLEAYVTEANGQNQGKFGVSLKDTDSGEFVSTIHFYKTKEEAIEAATKAAGLKVDKAAEESPKSTMADDGPKEGETKDGLVFHNGRWHKQGEDKPATEPAASLSLPEFHEGKNIAGVADYYNKLGNQIIQMAEAGDISGLQDLKAKGMQPNKKGKVGNTWAGKTDNSKILLKLHDDALKVAGKNAAISHLEQDKKQSDIADSEKTEDKKTVEKLRASSPDAAILQASEHLKEDISQDNVSAAEHAEDKALVGKLDAASGHTVSVEAATTNAWKTTLSANAFKGDNPIWFSQNNASHIAFSGKVKFQNQEPTEHAKQVLAEFNAAKAAGYEFKHFKATKLQSAYAFVKDGQILTKKGMEALVAGNAPQAAEPEKAKQPRMVIPKVLPKKPEPASAKLDQIPWDSLKLPADNKNAKTHNGKIEQIKKMAYAGDVEGLKAFKAGVNTYGKKQNKLAQTALAALEESQPVVNYSSSLSVVFSKVTDEQALNIAKMKLANNPDADAKNKIIAALKEVGKDAVAQTVSEIIKQNQTPDYVKDLKGAIKDAGSATAAKQVAQEFIEKHGATKENLHDATDALEAQGYMSQAYELLIENKDGASQETGPKEGDTKEGADGMLVFKNGRWHKMEDEKPSIQVSKLTSANATALGKDIKTAAGKKPMLKKMAMSGDIDGLINFINDPGNSSYAGSKLLAKKMISAMTGLGVNEIPTSPIGVAATQATKAPKAKATAPTSAQTSPTIDSMDAWKQVGGQQGSNDGGKFVDADGQEWYCKFPENEDHAKAEILAAKLYAAMGISSQDAKLISKNGKVGIASKWTNISKAGSPSELAGVKGVLSGFAADAWLGNWDVVGLGYDNMQIGANGEAHRVDAGGSLMYRAQGAKKAFGNVVSEVDSLRDPNINPQAASVFGGMSEADITASVAKVLGLSDATIKGLVNLYGPGSQDEKQALAETLIARKKDLAEKFPKATPVKQTIKPEFKVENLSLPPNFHDFVSSDHPQGGPLSSKEFINASNQAAVDAVYEAAKKGDLEFIRNAQAPVFDKNTGNIINHVPLSDHPSKHVRAYWSDMVSEVDLQLNPPRAPDLGEVVYSAELNEISAILAPVASGKSVAAVKKHQKIGDYIILGKVENIKPVTPKDDDTAIASSSWKEAAKQHYYASSSDAKSAFSTYVTTSGAKALNTALRQGKLLETYGGKTIDKYVKDFKELLVDIPEGSTFVRRMGMKGYGAAPNEKAIKELQQFLMTAEPGTVIQEPGFSSTSWSGGNKILSDNDIEWEFVAAKGVKMYPGWLTANSGEGEGLLPPNQRYAIVSSKKDGKTVRVKAILLPSITD